MYIFKIFVIDEDRLESSLFVQDVRVIEEGPLKRDEFYSTSMGAIKISDEMQLWFMAWARYEGLGRLISVLSPTFDLRQIMEEISLPGVGALLLMDSANPDRDWQNKSLLQEFQYLIRYAKFPYLVALSKQDLPNARTPQQMRDILAIPDDIKVMSYDLKDPSSTKKVALALLELMPQDEIMQQVIEGLNAKLRLSIPRDF